MAIVVRFYPGCYADLSRGIFCRPDGTVKELTKYEHAILTHITRDHQVHSREEIISWRWGPDGSGDVKTDRSVDKQMTKLRRLDGADGRLLQLFPSKTVPIPGYAYAGPLQSEESDLPEPPPPAQTSLKLIANDDPSSPPPTIAQEPIKELPSEPAVAGNSDARARFRDTGQISRPLSIDELLDRLSGLLAQVDCSRPPESQRELLLDLTFFFDMECHDLLQILDLQRLRVQIVQSRKFFRAKSGPMAESVCQLLDLREYKFQSQLLVQQIQLCQEGLAEAKRRNQVLEQLRFQQKLDVYMDQLAEAIHLHNLSRQTSL